MPELASIYQRVLDAVGERARVTRDELRLEVHGELDWFAWLDNKSTANDLPCEEADAANAIAVHWLLMLYASYKPADMTAVTRFAPEPPMLKDATIGELIESLAERVIRECKP